MESYFLGPLLKVSFAVLLLANTSCGNPSSSSGKNGLSGTSNSDGSQEETGQDIDNQSVTALLISPRNPRPGEIFHVLATGGRSVQKVKIVVSAPSGNIEMIRNRFGDGLPFWQIGEYKAGQAGRYKVSLRTSGSSVIQVDFNVTNKQGMGNDRDAINRVSATSNSVWTTVKGWDSGAEDLYAAWVNALFYDADERASWVALQRVTQIKERNFLYNFLSLNEDDPAAREGVQMQPDCADNPFYLRAYFSWKMGLPFGFHECDRGYVGKVPHTGKWVTNEMQIAGSPVRKFNTFVRMVANGVHSGTARTALNDENSDYYPVPLLQTALRPGVVFADPYGHTLILVRQIPQAGDKPGVLLSVDAQPDGTVGIKRFWKGNFLFNTSEVIGEPGFKAFRPIVLKKGRYQLLTSGEISADPGFVPVSMQQKNLKSEDFYRTMERIINPKPLDPETALLDLIQALYEQLTVRITSVANGEVYMKSHPGTVIPMPGSAAGIFQTGGIWEDFSTPNRDLRLLIAMDALLDFPDKIVRSPEDFKLPILRKPETVRKNLQELLEKKLYELSISYIRSDGREQKLTMGEILKRKEAFEIAYNPNDGIEIRWGAPQGSEERSSCKRHVPPAQAEKMLAIRTWFHRRMHPPT